MSPAKCAYSTSAPPPNTSPSIQQIYAEDEMRAAIRGWLRCSPERRPSARALGLRIAEIAANIEAADSPDDRLGMAWWNALTEQERARWMREAGNTGRAKDAWEAFKRASAGRLEGHQCA